MKNLLNKIRNKISKPLLYLSFPFLLYGCSKDESEIPLPQQREEVTHVLNQTELNNLQSYNPSNGEIIFKNPKTDVEAGDYLIGTINREAPYGFLREVVSVSGDKKLFQTKQGQLEETSVEGTGEEYYFLLGEDIDNKNSRLGKINISSSKKEGGFNFYADFDEVLYDLDGNISTTDDQINLWGRVEFSIDTYSKIKIHQKKIQEAKFEATFSGEALLEMRANLNTHIKEEIKIGELYFNPIVMTIGFAPVILVPQLEFFIGGEGQTDMGVETAFYDDFKARAALEYVDDRWVANKDFSNSFGFNVSVEGNASVKAYISPKVNLLLYGVSGSSARTDVYFDINVDTEKDPWWEMYGGLESKLGFDTGVLSKFIKDGEKTISDNRIKIADAGGPFVEANTPPDAYFVWTPSSGTPETIFSFNSSGSYDKEDGFDLKQRWDWETDGIWDTEFSYNKSIDHQFSSAGTHNVTLQVKDSKEATDELSLGVLVEEKKEEPGGDGEGILYDSRDGREYKTIIIGNQNWMAENLSYNIDGSLFYNNDSLYGETYGKLYSWERAQNVCPEGWSLPINKDISELILFLGINDETGGKLKSIGTIEDGTGFWYSPNRGATNESGFTALPGGYLGTNGNFDHLGYRAYFWNIPLSPVDNGDWFNLRNYSSGFYESYEPDYSKKSAASVRCVEDK